MSTKTVVVSARVTKSERRSIKAAARSYRLSVGKYLRMLHEDKEAQRATG